MAVFSNQATLSYNGNTTNSNIAYGEILDVLSVAKNAVDTSYSTNGLLTYVVTVRNTGSSTVTNVTLTDNLGGYTFGTGTVYPLTPVESSVRLFINGVLQPNPTVSAGPPLTISGISIPAGADAVIVYQANANQYANPNVGGTITNTVTVTGNDITETLTASSTVQAETEPLLSITKSISPTQVVDNDSVTYTFVIQNTGNTAVTASDTTSVTDTFNPILTGLSATLNGAAFTAYTYSDSTGVFTTTPGAITVPAATITQNSTTGAYTVVPGKATLTVTGTI